MKKLWIKVTVVILLLSFVLVMIGGNYLKKPMGKDDNVIAFVQIVEDSVINEDWNKAYENVDKLSRAWGKVKKRIQFSLERDEMNKVSLNIAALKGAILSKDKSTALVFISLTYENWYLLGK